MPSGETSENNQASQTRFGVGGGQGGRRGQPKPPTTLPATAEVEPRSALTAIPHQSAPKRQHRPAVYISELDQARLAAGKPASWQEPVDRRIGKQSGEVTVNKVPGQKTGKKPKAASFSPDDLRILREVPPHW